MTEIPPPRASGKNGDSDRPQVVFPATVKPEDGPDLLSRQVSLR